MTRRLRLETAGITPVTPFSADLSRVDLVGLTSNLHHLVEAGATLLYPAGNTGEVMSLPRRVDHGGRYRDRSGRRGGRGGPRHLPRVARRRGAGASCQDVGADGLLLMPRLQQACVPFEDLRARCGDVFNVAAVKRAMDALRLAGGAVRPPLRDFDEATPGRGRAVG